MTDSVNFAVLAPMPKEHLDSEAVVAAGKGYVCFGSQDWQLFQKLDGIRGKEEVPVLFYPSYEDAEAKLAFKVAYVGWYIGHVTSEDAKREDDQKGHRPPTVDNYRDNFDSPHHWAVFWRVRDIRQLPESEQVTIGSLSSYKTGHKRLNQAPRGPALVDRPGWLN